MLTSNERRTFRKLSVSQCFLFSGDEREARPAGRVEQFSSEGCPAVAAPGAEPLQPLLTGHQHLARRAPVYHPLAPSNNNNTNRYITKLRSISHLNSRFKFKIIKNLRRDNYLLCLTC